MLRMFLHHLFFFFLSNDKGTKQTWQPFKHCNINHADLLKLFTVMAAPSKRPQPRFDWNSLGWIVYPLITKNTLNKTIYIMLLCAFFFFFNKQKKQIQGQVQEYNDK